MRIRWTAIVVLVAMTAAACGDDSSGDAGPSDATDAAAEETDGSGDAGADSEAPTPTDPPAEDPPATDPPADEDPPPLAANFFSIDGTQYAITISTCFGVPDVDLEVIAAIRDAGGDNEAYAFVSTGDAGLVLSAFRVRDDAAGYEWSNDSGEGAADLLFEGGRIAGQVPVTSPDGTVAQAAFDFTCPGR